MKRQAITGEPAYLKARGWAKALRGMAAVWRKAWTPRTPPDPVAWVEGGGVILPSAVAARGAGGRLSFALRPYWRLMLRWFGEPGVEVIVVVVASQCGKTTGQIALALFGAEWLAGPGLFLMPSDDHAEDLVRDRLRPIFQASPFGRGLKANDMRLGGVTFPGGGSLNVIGVGSPNALKGRPARWVLFDEYDEALRYGAANGDPLERAKTRTRTYGSLARVVLTSTPTVENKGIWPEYEKARRYEWHVPCPKCGCHQALDMGQVKWPKNTDGNCSETPDRIAADNLAWYECVHCRAAWTDAQKRRAVADGRPFCLDEDRPMRQVALHVSVLYSPDVPLSKVAAQFLSAVDDPDKLIQFRNEWLAEPRREIVRTTSVDQAHLASLALPGYAMPAPDWWRSEDAPVAPDWVRAVTWGFDVQGAEIWGLCRGWGDYGESVVLWCGSFSGLDHMEDALTAFRREWVMYGGEVRSPVGGLMDSGYRTQEVYRACARTPGLLPSKGVQVGTVPVHMSHIDREKNRGIIGRTDLAVVWTTYWQDVTAAELEAGPGRGRNVVHLPANAPAYLYRHLTAERKVAVKGRNGQISYIWKPVHNDNHLRDCLVYSRAAAGIRKADKLTPRKALAYAPPDPVDPVQTATAPTAPPAPMKPSTALQRLAAARNAGTLGTARGFRAS
jgi:phage terminase large subunit GpA-like protein